VPGAGFRKTLALARRHQLSRADLLAARQAYARLLGKDDLRMDDITEAVAEGVEQGIARRRRRAARTEQPDLAAHASSVGADGDNRATPVDAERQRFEQERAEFEAQKREFATRQHWAQAERDVERLIHAGKVLPAENLPNGEGHPELTAVLAETLSTSAPLYARLLARYEARAPQIPLGEQIPVIALPADGSAATGTDDVTARRRRNLERSDLGRAVLKREK
jgi:hypothetical protein